MTFPEKTGSQKNRKSIANLGRNPLFWIVLLTLLYALVLVIRPSEGWFGVPGEWTWSGRPPALSTYARWPPAILALVVTAILAILVDRQWDQSNWKTRILALASLVILIPVIQILLRYIHHQYPLESYLHRTIGPLNGFWQTAISIESLPQFLRQFDRSMVNLRDQYIHIATHPPGTLIYLWLWRQLFTALPNLSHSIAHTFRLYACSDLQFVRLSDAQIATAFGQIAVTFLSGLAIIPMYLWAKQLTTSRSAWRAAALFTLLPTLSLFTMRWDTLYPIFTASAFATLHRGLTTKKKRWWFVSGSIVSLASFFSFGNAILAPTVALYAIIYIWLKDRSFKQFPKLWQHWCLLIVGGYSVWGVYHIYTGITLWDLLAITGAIQAELRSAYSYPKWLFYNLYDIFAMSGFAISLPFIVQSLKSLKNWGQRDRHDGKLSMSPLLAFVAIIVLVDLSGLSPGETARLWLHLTTGMIITAVLWLKGSKQERIFPVLVALMAFQCLWLTLFLRVSDTNYPSYNHRTPTIGSSSPSQLAQYQDGITLSTIDISPDTGTPGEQLAVTLNWFAQTRPDIPYTVFVQMLDAKGVIVAQSDAMPVNNSLPTTCWQPGETIADTHLLNIPEHTPPGEYQLHIGWYDLRTMTRLPLVNQPDPADVFVSDIIISASPE